MRRRSVLAALVAMPLAVASRFAWGGSYLNRAALLLQQSRAERDMVLPRPNDKELLRMVHTIAEARAKSARTMEVPKVIAHAHPHLLLVLENSERAYAAAIRGNHQRFLQHILRARAEDKTFRALVENMDYTLPNTG
jgi:chromatin segregation and condensation protein Rec8/ScpA/Scc1 (kleisin family)